MKSAHPTEEELSLVLSRVRPYAGYVHYPRRLRRVAPQPIDETAIERLSVVIIAHVDTGPLWYQWIARAGHHAWLWYGTDAFAGVERLVREVSPDVLVLDASSAEDPGWVQVRDLRHRFAHAKLPVLVVSGDAGLAQIPDVRVVPEVPCAEELLAALAEMAALTCPGQA
jgi:hypothetical protein